MNRGQLDGVVSGLLGQPIRETKWSGKGRWAEQQGQNLHRLKLKASSLLKDEAHHFGSVGLCGLNELVDGLHQPQRISPLGRSFRHATYRKKRGQSIVLVTFSRRQGLWRGGDNCWKGGHWWGDWWLSDIGVPQGHKGGLIEVHSNISFWACGRTMSSPWL